MGTIVHRVVRGGAVGRLYDLSYWLIVHFPPTRWLQRALSWLLGRRGLERLVRHHDPHVVVSTYPGVNDVLGRLRRRGAIRAPLVSAITDLAALRFWAHPDFSLHLITHAESQDEVRALAGPETRITHVRGLTEPAFLAPREAAEARGDLGLDDSAPVVLVSGGGWGVGDLEGAVTGVLEADERALVVCLCGRNDAVRDQLAADFAEEPRVRVLGFTDRMSDHLAAADVLVHSTAGLTVLEAQIRGAHVISYGWGIGHIRANNAAYQRCGLAQVAGSRAELVAAVRRALGEPRSPDCGLTELPSAASEVLSLVRAGHQVAHGG